MSSPIGIIDRGIVISLNEVRNMGYRITYGPEEDRILPPGNRTGRIRMMTAAFLLCFCLGVKIFAPSGCVQLRRALLPGEKTQAEEAFLMFMEEIKEGDGVGDSLETFCRRLVLDAGENLR
jgi:hypothetical protein